MYVDVTMGDHHDHLLKADWWTVRPTATFLDVCYYL